MNRPTVTRVEVLSLASQSTFDVQTSVARKAIRGLEISPRPTDGSEDPDFFVDEKQDCVAT